MIIAAVVVIVLLVFWAISIHNNIIAVFPNNLLAGGRSPRTSFQVTDESARQAPNVQF